MGGETGPARVHLHVGGRAHDDEADLTALRRRAIADSYARFRRMRGDAVLCSQPLDAGADPAADRWIQGVFLQLLEAGLVERSETQLAWCERCRTLLPGSGGDASGPCQQCGEPVAPVAKGDWYLRLDTYAEESTEPWTKENGHDAIRDAHDRVLGRIEGVEVEAHVTNGTPISVFSQSPGAVSKATFVAVSPHHPALQELMAWEEAQEQLAQLRKGKAPTNHKGIYPSIFDTAVWIQVPGVDDLLPMIVSLAVDARYGATAVLGIPSADPLDERLAEHLPPPPAMHIRMKVKGSKPQPAERLRGRYLPIGSGEGGGFTVPVLECNACGAVPLGLADLPLSAGEERSCPKCGEQAPANGATLDPAIADWADMLAEVPAEERQEASFEHPEIQRTLSATISLHDRREPASMISSLLARKALRDQGVADAPSPEQAWEQTVLTGPIDRGESAEEPEDEAQSPNPEAVRFALLFAAAPPKGLGGGDFEPTLLGAERFLEQLRSYAEPRLSAQANGATDGSTRLQRRLAAWSGIAADKVAQNFEALEPHKAARNVMLLLARIEDFEERSRGDAELSAADAQAVRSALLVLLALLAPIAPQLSGELWQSSGSEGSIDDAPWPSQARDNEASQVAA